MKMNRVWLFVVTALLAGCGGSKDKSMLLKDWDSVFVPLGIETLTSMDDALKEKGIGNVKSSDMKLVFTYMDSEFSDGIGPGAIVYSDIYAVPPRTMFMEMRVWQCYEAILNDPRAKGIHVNPDAPNKKPYTVSATEMRGALDKLPRQPRMPMDISIKN
ncbi:MAG TPA: hypothetical protein PLT67_07615 [Kiritimatiellia bacterium]|nr:hypothetical protein [Kiritimatiellia bacterium]HQQ04693.1 hypothetical protein [Kiritimatiellia bacterium]